ncbi:MAG: excinuclease ABC subunit UvrC [Candidatus Omnitrophica bacterium]|nr:excinuclease ABC subunit UvrC [Candidatus Omnitrophota bacterium]
MKSNEGKVIYVGKATSLKKRVNSYFQKFLLNEKTAILVSKINDIDYIVCDSEAQALILEASLIKQHKPRYNVALKDDKSYPYIEVTNEEYPRIFVSRPKGRKFIPSGEEGIILIEDGNKSSRLFGPYSKVKLIKEALHLIRRIFPYRSCKNLPKKPCLFYHLNLCPAPCIGKITFEEYRDIVENICRIIKGEKEVLVDSLEKKMLKMADEKRFEEAAFFRDKLTAVYNLYAGKTQLHQLISLKDLLKLPKLPILIEAIDISNLTGKEPAGSLVVFRDGLPDKSNYRRFKITYGEYPNDYEMIAEVVRRRYTRLKNENRTFPNLIIIDGGKGHVSRAKEELDKLNLDIPIIGIAKGNEEIWCVKENKPLIIPRDNPSLHLIQRIRDEAHRFAHKYHTLLRKKKIVSD